MLSLRPLRLLQFRQGALCLEEGFRKEISLSGVRRQHVTECTVKTFCKAMGRSSGYVGACILARQAVCLSVQRGKCFSRTSIASMLPLNYRPNLG